MTSAKPKLELTGSRQFVSWLAEHQLSLSFSTYQAGKLFFIGLSGQQQLSVFERTFTRCMGIGLDPQTQSLWVASLYQIWRFENALKPGQIHQGYDRVYVPQVGFTTGDVDAHDIAVDQQGPDFVNTLFSFFNFPALAIFPCWPRNSIGAAHRCEFRDVLSDRSPVIFFYPRDVKRSFGTGRVNADSVLDRSARHYL